MTHKVAIVFDSSGTLMHTYRVAKDMESRGTLYDTVTLHLVSESQALVAIDISPDALSNYPPDQVLPRFLSENKIDINIGCASDDITTDDVRNMLKHDLGGARVSDLLDVVAAVREKCKHIFYIGTGFVIDVPTGTIHYVVCSGGKLFDGAEATIAKLADCADLYIASGDSMRNLSILADRLKIPQDHVVPVATPHIKERLILDLKKTYDIVVMVGDEINDLRAIRAADMGVLTMQQCSDKLQKLCDSADILIPDISSLPDVIRDVKLSKTPSECLTSRASATSPRQKAS
ncbi:MAG: haloacid dehalogenase [Candidatus Methanogaster sp.]|uniref:Haloacid dehalogenase n=1 Tax=Candidatus Methanogaster sp. TaxID=3386292 RepID=A0AC61KZ66_9EURY|nr:MAG: haloacid dehalogenase [ANME-2 cluster archaeon]